ncbi:MAG: NUDIX domain-containing protein [Candidatus Chisholmbacteria bacterium]|nr:NUDIX domain-containing protein [Candidatus Chisholmbacteria bacterium]
MRNQVLLVDENDVKVGLMEKRAAHEGVGELHRAISVLIYRPTKFGELEILLQKRSAKKPLWPRYWADTTSTHPMDGESYETSTVRRLKEEMGISILEKDLQLVFKLRYQARYNKELSENEIDGLLVGQWDGKPELNKNEAEDFSWVAWEKLERETKRSPKDFAVWLPLIVQDERILELFNRERREVGYGRRYSWTFAG